MFNFQLWNLGLKIWILGFKIQNVGFKIRNLGFKIPNLGFKIQNVGLKFEIWASNSPKFREKFREIWADLRRQPAAAPKFREISRNLGVFLHRNWIESSKRNLGGLSTKVLLRPRRGLAWQPSGLRVTPAYRAHYQIRYHRWNSIEFHWIPPSVLKPLNYELFRHYPSELRT